MKILDIINSELPQAAMLLDNISGKIQEAPELENRENILLIGKVLSHIFELQKNIYEHRPDLKNIHEQNND
ncbi:hypothetical protein [Acinetobacter sp.]|uniref:hypothetical protein n=2 Tax=unclassified Acinetobacter TaxID=196816 RepID=UPI003B00C606